MSRTYFQLFAALAFLVAALIGYAFWYHALGKVSGDLSDLTAKVVARNQNAAQAVAAEDELAKLSTEEGAIRGYFVSPADIVTFLEGLQTLGTSLGAKVSVVSVAANPAPRPHLDLSLSVSGSFDAVMRTVGAIEYSPHDIVVKSLTIDTSAPESGPAAAWTAALAMQVGTASSTPALPGKTATTTP